MNFRHLLGCDTIKCCGQKFKAHAVLSGIMYDLYWTISNVNTLCQLSSVPARKVISRELKQIDAAAINKQISIQKDSRPSDFSRPLTLITLN